MAGPVFVVDTDAGAAVAVAAAAVVAATAVGVEAFAAAGAEMLAVVRDRLVVDDCALCAAVEFAVVEMADGLAAASTVLGSAHDEVV